ncbi:MAG: porin, partial [Candidatus Anammoxibacter sp.]
DQTELTLWFGMDIFRNLSFTSEVEFEDGFKEFTFEKFEFDWNIFKNLATFKFGKFIYPFGIERLVEDAPFNKLISRPSPFKRIIPGTYSDNGIELYGIIPLISTIQLKYELALTAGLSGPSRKGEQNFDENNDSKTIGGRLGLVLFPGLEIGSSYSTGKYDDNERSRLDFIGFDLAFQKGGFELRGEYIRGNVESSDKIAESFDRDGYYLQMSYKYMPEFNHLRFLEGVVRFDSVDPNDLVTNESDTDRVSFGINYSPMEHIELKLEYVLENEATENLEKNLLFQTILRW